MFEQSVLERIKVITHSGIRIDGEKVIYIDPVQIQGEPHDADLILFTHPHFDHFSPKDVKKILKPSTTIAAPKSMRTMCKLMLRQDIISLLPDERIELCGITIQTVHAYNKFKPFHLKAMKWLGYILTIGETRVYISGDTDITEDSTGVNCDIAVLPIGGFYTVDPVKAAELAKAVSAHTVIPVHYGKFLGGEGAAEKFRSSLDKSIEADIRPCAFSNIMVSMYAKAAVLIVLAGILGYIAGTML